MIVLAVIHPRYTITEDAMVISIAMINANMGIACYSGCLTCTGEHHTDCVTCPANKVLYQGECQGNGEAKYCKIIINFLSACYSECTSCINGNHTSCTSCNSGRYLATNNECIRNLGGSLKVIE